MDKQDCIIALKEEIGNPDLFVDLYLQSKDEDGFDYIVEVKNKKSKISNQEIHKFIEEKKILEDIVGRKTGFIFYSINGLTEGQEEELWNNGIMVART